MISNELIPMLTWQIFYPDHQDMICILKPSGKMMKSYPSFLFYYKTKVFQ